MANERDRAVERLAAVLFAVSSNEATDEHLEPELLRAWHAERLRSGHAPWLDVARRMLAGAVFVDPALGAAYRATLDSPDVDRERILIYVGDGDCGTEVERAETADALAQSILAQLGGKP